MTAKMLKTLFMPVLLHTGITMGTIKAITAYLSLRMIVHASRKPTYKSIVARRPFGACIYGNRGSSAYRSSARMRLGAGISSFFSKAATAGLPCVL